MANPSGIPQIATQVLMPDGTMNPLWYRYLRGIGTVAMGSVILIQDTLANRPSAAEFADGSVLFIATDRDLMYYVSGSAWVQIMNFIGFDGTTVTVNKPTDITGALAVTGAITSTTDISASGTIHGQFLTVVSTGQIGGALTVTSGGLSVLGGGAAITGATAVTGNLTSTAILAGNSVTSTTTATAGTQFIIGSTGGETHTVPLAPLTTLGTAGSIDFTGGIETGHVDPT